MGWVVWTQLILFSFNCKSYSGCRLLGYLILFATYTLVWQCQVIYRMMLSPVFIPYDIYEFNPSIMCSSNSYIPHQCSPWDLFLVLHSTVQCMQGRWPELVRLIALIANRVGRVKSSDLRAHTPATFSRTHWNLYTHPIEESQYFPSFFPSVLPRLLAQILAGTIPTK